MSVRCAKLDEIQSWNNYISANPGGGNILQGKEFLEIKAKSGWKIKYLFVDDRAVAIMERKIPILGKFWYIPKGPSSNSFQDLTEIIKKLTVYAKKIKVFCIKIEPEIITNSASYPKDWYPTMPVQPNFATILLDLSPSIEIILEKLNQKGRHAIKRAERDGVKVNAVLPTDINCKIMYNLMRETGKNSGFVVRPEKYYRTFYQHYKDNGQLFFAYYNNEVVAGAFAIVQGKKSMYKDGASVRVKPAYGASHLLQWQVIKWAKQSGSLIHDLAGTPPINDIHNPNHPLYNVGKFKRQFNNKITEYVGAFNVSVSPMRAKFWNKIAEKLTKKLYFIVHKESFY